MGLRERFKQLLGVAAEEAATADADPDDLFGMSTAAVTMEADLGFVPDGMAGLCFSGVDSTQFADTVQEARAILDRSEAESGAVAEFHEDDHGYQWVVVEATSFEDLVTNCYAVADTLIQREFGDRLLATAFAFAASDRASIAEGRRVYWIYSFNRGCYYPFVPNGLEQRDEATEFTLKSVLDGELAVEDDHDYWYPLWPDEAGGYPWE